MLGSKPMNTSRQGSSITDHFGPVIWGICAISLLSGCSIAMALNGHPDPDFSHVQAGSTQEEIQHELGVPVTSVDRGNGRREETYRYEIENSHNPGRATVYGYVLLATIGIAEPILSLIEVFQGSNEETRVVYDENNRAVDISGYRPPAASAALLAAQEAQAAIQKSSASSSNGQGQSTRSENPDSVVASVDVKLKELAIRLGSRMREEGIARVAVLPAQDTSGKENQALGNYLTEKLTVKLHEEKVGKVIERTQLTRVTQEIAQTHGGAFDEGSVMRIGKLLGVEAVVTTIYADLGQSSIEITSKLVRVETGEILGASAAVVPRSAVERMIH